MSPGTGDLVVFTHAGEQRVGTVTDVHESMYGICADEHQWGVPKQHVRALCPQCLHAVDDCACET